MAISFALYSCSSWGTVIKTIFSSNEDLVKAVKQGFFENVWKMNLQVNALRELIANSGGPRLIATPKCWNRAASSLAMHGLNHHDISLFHQGRDLPKWLMKSLRHQGG